MGSRPAGRLGEPLDRFVYGRSLAIASACDQTDIVLATAPDSVGRSWQGSSDQFVWSLPGDPFSLVAIDQVSRDDRIVKDLRLHIAEQ